MSPQARWRVHAFSEGLRQSGPYSTDNRWIDNNGKCAPNCVWEAYFLYTEGNTNWWRRAEYLDDSGFASQCRLCPVECVPLVSFQSGVVPFRLLSSVLYDETGEQRLATATRGKHVLGAHLCLSAFVECIVRLIYDWSLPTLRQQHSRFRLLSVRIALRSFFGPNFPVRHRLKQISSPSGFLLCLAHLAFWCKAPSLSLSPATTTLDSNLFIFAHFSNF